MAHIFPGESNKKEEMSMTNGRWQLPPTPISTSIQPSTVFPFALGLIIPYGSLVQKALWYIFLIIKKLGSRQTAV
jgi:hypothetical protein